MDETDGARRWPVLGRVALFIVSCAVVLAATSPLASAVLPEWRELVTGAMASGRAFALTAQFVRWEGLRLSDVGAGIEGRSAVRLGVGFLGGLFLVAV